MFFATLLACAVPPTAPPHAPVASNDTVALGKLYRPPDGLGQVVWAYEVVGAVGLGPTDLRLALWFPEVPASRRDGLLTAPLAVPLPRDPLALALLPEGASAAGAYQATAFEGARWGGTAAWMVGDGLYVVLYSR